MDKVSLLLLFPTTDPTGNTQGCKINATLLPIGTVATAVNRRRGKIFTEELNGLNCSPYTIPVNRLKWAVHVAGMADMINANKVLVGKTERRQRGKAWKSIIRLTLKKWDLGCILD
jgi:hypothetical protein